MPSKYGWEALQRRGDHVVVPGVTAKQVSSSAKTFVERRFGQSAQVVAATRYDESGRPVETVVLVAYVPPQVQASPVRTGPPVTLGTRGPALVEADESEEPEVDEDEVDEDVDVTTGDTPYSVED